jgi:hypothetical protein
MRVRKFTYPLTNTELLERAISNGVGTLPQCPLLTVSGMRGIIVPLARQETMEEPMVSDRCRKGNGHGLRQCPTEGEWR